MFAEWVFAQELTYGLQRIERTKRQFDDEIASSGKEPVHRAFLDLTSPLE